MTKTMLFLAVLLFAPSLAHSQSPSADLSVNVVPASSSGKNRCNANGVPPAAQAAGFTSLAFCEDFSQAKYSNLSNWFDTSGQSNSFFEQYCANPHCDSNHIYQGTDPTTGNTVLILEWDQADCQQGNCYRIQWNTCNGNCSAGTVFPAGHYVEVRWHLGTNLATTCSDPSPDLCWWAHGANSLWEQDVIEMYGGYYGCGLSAGVLNWQLSCNQAYITNFPRGGDQTPNTYGMLTTYDGNSSARISSWYNGAVYVNGYSNPLTGTSCGGAQQTEEMYLATWFGGFGIDQDLPGPVMLYIEYIAEWECPAGVPQGNPLATPSDPTCVGNGLQP